MMAAEQAQRLIAMSLGKIAASRNQRGGANLHRSLLVSTVLHKARTTIMMENFQAMMQQRRAQMEAQQRTEMAAAAVEEERPSTPAPPALEEPSSRWDKENSPPAAPCSPPQPCDRLTDPAPSPIKEQNNNNSYFSTSNSQQEQNNKPSPLQQSNAENVLPQTANCAKCVKRRSSELSGPDEDFLATKRTKYESDSELSHEPSGRSDCVFDAEDCYDAGDESPEEEEDSEEDCENACPEPMQTDPVQITHLVHRFNSGLSGLLTQVANESQQQLQCGSDQAFTSCCTQVKDSGIESLSRPCIALTV